jgi:hypothetical protein
MIDPKDVAFFVPPGLKKFKQKLFNRIADHIQRLGGAVVRDDYKALEQAAEKRIPIIGCTPQFAEAIKRWRLDRVPWIYWDRGYLRRVFATWLPNGHDLGVPGGYYRWHLNHFQMSGVRDKPDDRWRRLKLDHAVKPFAGAQALDAPIIVAHTLPDYWNVRGLPEDWSFRIAKDLQHFTNRRIIVRDKESKVPLDVELAGAHCLVTHGSIAAVEAIVMGKPVFVDPESAAAPMGLTDLSLIEAPVFPMPEARQRWLNALAYCQFNEAELCDGTLWRLIE